MIISWWRRLWKEKPGRSRGKRLPAKARSRRRPQLEPLEDRTTPSALAGGIAAYAAQPPAAARLIPVAAAYLTPPVAWVAPVVVGGLKPTSATPPGGANRMAMTYEENSPAARIDLSAVFGAVRGIRPDGGLQLAMLGNTNPALVKTALSEAELTLTFAAGKSGKATITVSATDADGVSVQETLLVTVLPQSPAGAGMTPTPVGAIG